MCESPVEISVYDVFVLLLKETVVVWIEELRALASGDMKLLTELVTSSPKTNSPSNSTDGALMWLISLETSSFGSAEDADVTNVCSSFCCITDDGFVEGSASFKSSFWTGVVTAGVIFVRFE